MATSDMAMAHMLLLSDAEREQAETILTGLLHYATSAAFDWVVV